MWRRIIKGLNAVSEEPIEGLTAHVFRHNYATELCYIGLPHSHEKKEFHWHIYYIKRKKEPDIASFCSYRRNIGFFSSCASGDSNPGHPD